MPMSNLWATSQDLSGVQHTVSGQTLIQNLLGTAETNRNDRITPATVTRIIGEIAWLAGAEASPAPGTPQTLSAGIIVVRRTVAAAGAGDAQIPDPIDPAEEARWLWRYTATAVRVGSDTPASFSYPHAEPVRFVLDIRVQRKMADGETLALVTNTSHSAGTHDPFHTYYTRMLLKR